MNAAAAASEYGADSIIALEGLDPVRKRPSMYIGTTGKQGLHHLLWEVVDNCVDEAMAGFASKVVVTLNPDGSVRVEDDGRGIPIEPQHSGSYKGMPTVEMVLTVLHAGGKFGTGAYNYSGGLHGVGISVVNALSRWTKIEVIKEGRVWGIEFGYTQIEVDGVRRMAAGVTTSPLTDLRRAPKDASGTTVTFLPDDEVFSDVTWDRSRIIDRLQHTAFLNPGLSCTLIDLRDDGNPTEDTFLYPNGLLDFMAVLTEGRLSEIAAKKAERGDESETTTITPEAIRLSGKEDLVGAWDVCLQWYPDTDYRVYSYANGIATTDGGTHVDGVRQVMTRMMNKFARQEHIGMLTPRDPNLEGRDILSGLGGIVAVKVREPQFEGQTKGRLGNDSVLRMVSSGFYDAMWSWMEEHPTETRLILDKAINEMRLRNKMADILDKERRSQEKRGTAARSQAVPSKLNDCETRNREEAELFITEGDSAAGSAIAGRNTKTQAVLPIRGKTLNIEVADAERIANNKEVQSIIAALGAGSEDMFELDKARYGKVVILADADDDGRHIQLLLMTMFYRLMREYVEDGHLYVARTPLFVTTIRDKKVYAYSETERDGITANTKGGLVWTRFKGLGEMNSDELELSLNPDTRVLVQVTVPDSEMASASIEALMGSDTWAKWETLADIEMSDAESVSF